MKTLRRTLLFQLACALCWAHTAAAQTDITNSAGTVTAQYSDSPAGEDIGKVIDNQPASKYLTFHSAAWIQFQAAAPAVVTKYTLTSGNDWDERDPKNWTLKASTDGAAWVTLNTQANQDFTERNQKKEYSFSNTSAYSYYRLETTNNGDTKLQLAEWELWGIPATAGVATVFQHVGYAGTGVALPVGSYTTAQLQAKGVVNNWISSVKVASGYNVVFYDNDNFQGPSLTKTADDATLVDDGWNDRATSLVVSAATPPAPAAPTELAATAVSASQINLAWKDNSGTETLFRIERSTDGTTHASVATVGANATAYTDTGLSAGTRYFYRIRAENSGGASAYSGAASATTAGSENVATVYADCAFTTNGVALPVGTYTTAQLQARGISNGSISSVKVAGGYQVILYDNDNFTGGSVAVSVNNSCLTDNGFDFNDRTSSLKVQLYDPNTSAPIEPSYLRALGTGGTSIQLTWTDNSVNETSFRIERSTSTTNFTSVATVGPNTTTYTSTGLAPGTKYYYRVRAEGGPGNSRYSNITGAHTQETPPATIGPDYVAPDHARHTMTLLAYNDDVAFYGDASFLANHRAQVDAWINSFVTGNWKYIKANYGSFGANRLYCFMHGFDNGGTISSMFDTRSGGRNTIDVGAAQWSASNHTLREVLTHEMGHIIEGSSYNVHGSPFFPIWGDSKWCEIEVYDIFYKTGLADAQRSYNGFLNQTKDGVYWFRDWFYPLWRDYGQTKFLSNYFELLAQHFPKGFENNTNAQYARDANRGEFFYFLSGAAGVSLKAKATAVFGWTATTEAQWQQAKRDYPGIQFTENQPTTGLWADAEAATSAPASFRVFPNPNQGEATLRLEAKEAHRATVYVHDAQGYLVSLLTVPMQAGHTDFKLPTHLPRGTYYLRTRLDGQDQRFTLRVE